MIGVSGYERVKAMNIQLSFGDTNFIGLVNTDTYQSFVNEEWEFAELMQHFGQEMATGHILVYQMTDEGNEHSWNIEVASHNDEIVVDDYYRKAEGYIQVTNNVLYIVDYDCLTMSAQFADEPLPDANCEANQILIENGHYQVCLYQFYDADQDRFIGRNDVDITLVLSKVSQIQHQPDRVFWCSV